MQKKIANLRILAQRAKEIGDYTGAANYYRQILMEKPNDWEGMFYESYCSMVDYSVASISANANRLKLIFEKSYQGFLLSMALQTSKDPSFDMTVPMKQLSRDMTTLLLAMKESAMKFHREFSGTAAETEQRLRALGTAALGIGDVYYSHQHKTLAANFYKLAQDLMNGVCNIGELAVYRIREVDPSFHLPQQETTAPVDWGAFFKYFFKWFGICFGIPWLIFMIYILLNQ